MRDIVRMISDKDSFFEITKYFGKGIITGFARLNGSGARADCSGYFIGA